MTLIDISRPIDDRLAIWPGDAETKFARTFSIEDGASVNVGQLRMSVHSGTHCDAPLHFDNEAVGAGQLPLDPFLGRCRVIDVRGTMTITLEKIRAGLSGSDADQIPPRVLLRTDRWTDSACFPDSIPVVTTDVVEWLGTRNVRLIGVDLPSVDQLDDAELPVHFALQRCGIHILEGLDLTRVEPGEYELIALPLPIVGADGSPVRAVLRA